MSEYLDKNGRIRHLFSINRGSTKCFDWLLIYLRLIEDGETIENLEKNKVEVNHKFIMLNHNYKVVQLAFQLIKEREWFLLNTLFKDHNVEVINQGFRGHNFGSRKGVPKLKSTYSTPRHGVLEEFYTSKEQGKFIVLDEDEKQREYLVIRNELKKGRPEWPSIYSFIAIRFQSYCPHVALIEKA